MGGILGVNPTLCCMLPVVLLHLHLHRQWHSALALALLCKTTK
jgi:hypothetical protein